MSTYSVEDWFQVALGALVVGGFVLGLVLFIRGPWRVRAVVVGIPLLMIVIACLWFWFL